MLGWAVYDFVKQPNDTSNSSKNEEIETTNSDNKVDSDVAAGEESDKADEITVGLEIGNAAPDFQLQTLDGSTVKLSDYRGKRVMVNFWATWCPPCRAEMPDLEKFHQNNDVIILAVNLTQTEQSMQEIKDFVHEFELTFPILLDKNIEVANRYAIRPIPTSFMIDSNGIIRNKAFGALHYEMMVQELEQMK